GIEGRWAQERHCKRIDSFLEERGWKEKKFTTKIRVDKEERDSPTHKVDCFKECVGLEIEWNNKDPFFDRDLNNFRLLFDLRVIDAGVIITRASHLQRIFKSLGKKVADKDGPSTTHMDKLFPRMSSRAYYHYKSADWKGNKPHPLKARTAAEMAKIPTYYVMERDKGMAATVAPFMP